MEFSGQIFSKNLAFLWALTTSPFFTGMKISLYKGSTNTFKEIQLHLQVKDGILSELEMAVSKAY